MKNFLVKIYRLWENDRDKKILELLEFNPKARVLDLGCGNGTFTLKVKEKVGTDEIYGVDIWDEAIEEAKKKGINVYKADLNRKLDFIEDESFDVIVSNQVIEHLLYPMEFIKEIYRILKPSGYAVVSTENLSSWDNIFALLFGYTPFSVQFDNIKIGNPFSPHNLVDISKYPPHLRIFTYKSLIDIFNMNGFKVENVFGSGHVIFNFNKFDKRHSRFLILKVRK